jgi:chitosanase
MKNRRRLDVNYTPDQKRAIDCVLAVFETGRVPTSASYATCTILADGAGISYGKHQCTDKAGSLDLVVKEYVKKAGRHAKELEACLPLLTSNASTKVPPKGPWGPEVTGLVNLLKTAGADPIMHQAQDEVFDANYFLPALNHAKDIGLTTALGLLVIYDTCIHSGPGRVSTHRAAFPEKSPKNGGDEKAWIKAYLNARRAWLAASSNALVQKTVYRQDAILELIKADNWDLKFPFTVRGVKVC